MGSLTRHLFCSQILWNGVKGEYGWILTLTYDNAYSAVHSVASMLLPKSTDIDKLCLLSNTARSGYALALEKGTCRLIHHSVEIVGQQEHGYWIY
jgi:hypothetical protein